MQSRKDAKSMDNTNKNVAKPLTFEVLEKSKMMIRKYLLETKGIKPEEYEIFIESCSKNLFTFKGRFITNLPDSDFYEITFNGYSKEPEWYFNVYRNVNYRCYGDKELTEEIKGNERYR